jgi:hypothetical protein
MTKSKKIAVFPFFATLPVRCLSYGLFFGVNQRKDTNPKFI